MAPSPRMCTVYSSPPPPPHTQESEGDERMPLAGGAPQPEDARGKAQLVLQLAQWMTALGQGGRDEIMREWSLLCVLCVCVV